MTMPIAAIEALINLLSQENPKTTAEIISTIKRSTETLISEIPNSISLRAGCDIFTRFVIRNLRIYGDLSSCNKHLVENGELFVNRAMRSRDKIAEIGLPFISDDDIILLHGYSRAVFALLKLAADRLIRFRCVVTEGRPSNRGVQIYNLLVARDIPTKMIVDSAVGTVIDKIDKVFVGAEGVAESGGIINFVGTYPIGVLAQTAKKPFYVVAETHKFIRMFPLSPHDLPMYNQTLEFNKSKVQVENSEDVITGPVIDYTAQEYITALITDLGVLTPSAVSEELIKMWD